MPEKEQRKDGRIVLLWFLAFFGVIVAVDTVFVTIAIRTQTGVVAEHAYERGLAYNGVLDDAKRQKDEGLAGQIDLVAGKTINFRLSDRIGKPLSGATVKAHIIRSVQQGHDFDISLTDKGNGIYQAGVTFPMQGLWNIDIEAVWQGHPYYISQSIMTPSER